MQTSNIREELLHKVKHIICADRCTQYGEPEDNFSTIAKLWSAYLNIEFDSADVAIMMALLKIARLAANKSKLDSYLDLAGYAICGASLLNTSDTTSTDMEAKEADI